MMFERYSEEFAQTVERFRWTHAPWNSTTSLGESVEENLRFVKTIYAACAAYALAVEGCVVSYQRHVLKPVEPVGLQRSERRGIPCIVVGESVDTCAEIFVVVRLGAYK